ncbi:MAG: YgaP family membrane protein [Nitrospiria bacterium]
MSIENQIRAFAGGMILLSIALTLLYSHGWLFLTGFVGVNLLQSSFTRFCPLEMILRRIEGTKK